MSSGDTHSNLSGSSKDVVQAGHVSGGIHFHEHDAARRERRPTPRQLPADVRHFVNRSDELQHLHATLSGDEGVSPVAVYVIAGTAGAGKTSLALRWAHQVKEQFTDGHLYANLRGYDPGDPVSAQELLSQFLIALGILPAAIPSDMEAASGLYRSLLADRKMLIILDNAATAAQVRPLLPGHAHCLTVVTSRGRLSGSERQWSTVT